MAASSSEQGRSAPAPRPTSADRSQSHDAPPRLSCSAVHSYLAAFVDAAIDPMGESRCSSAR